ncbi:unnamed protein product [Lactuca virosa]|uniref:Uncharacterized protein n=1 Tax=Lactuca virosa TaxID=75947 RepID=A0AAU9LKQ0_9ASTR|nr:unnamed protein product [Lactuca virosa]
MPSTSLCCSWLIISSTYQIIRDSNFKILCPQFKTSHNASLLQLQRISPPAPPSYCVALLQRLSDFHIDLQFLTTSPNECREKSHKWRFNGNGTITICDWCFILWGQNGLLGCCFY